MEQVSKILENIIVLEQPDEDGKASSEKQRTIAERRLSRLQEQLSEVEPSHDLPRLYSDFWYLEDDQKKLSNQLTDKLVEKVLSVIINAQAEPTKSLDGRMKVHSTRPPLSVKLMSTNTTQMAQKTGPVFEFIDGMTLLVCWNNPFFTVGACLLVTHAILNPYLITTIPSFILLKKFLIPSYMKLYPPDQSVVDNKYIFHNPIPYDGPPLDRYEPPRPISQFSREFIMNFTDLQNQMVPYIRLYDALANWGKSYFLFEDAILSTVVYLVVFTSMITNVVFLPHLLPLLLAYFPIKLFAIITVWVSIGALHPVIKSKALDYVDTEEARLSRLEQMNQAEKFMMKFVDDHDEKAHVSLREVEIFELHRLTSRNIWKPLGYTSDFYSINNPKRLAKDEVDTDDDNHGSGHDAGDDTENSIDEEDIPIVTANDDSELITGKELLSEVRAPKNWTFADRNWRIDLDPIEWVNDECIMDLVSVDDDEKWVYDYVDGEGSPDKSVYRRRRWVRVCERETHAGKSKEGTK